MNLDGLWEGKVVVKVYMPSLHASIHPYIHPYETYIAPHIPGFHISVSVYESPIECQCEAVPCQYASTSARVKPEVPQWASPVQDSQQS